MRVYDTQLLQVSPADLKFPGLLTSGFLWKNETDIEVRVLKQNTSTKKGSRVDQEIAKAVKWETLRSLAQKGHWKLAEPL